MARNKSILKLSIALLLSAGCVSTPKEPASPNLSLQDVARRIPDDVTDKQGWAGDIIAAIEAAKKAPNAERVCAVIAIIDQESGFNTDPVVKGLSEIVRSGLRKKFERLGILADAAVAALLTGKAPGSAQTFEQRIAKLRTERDLDLFFRDLAEAYRSKLPGSFFVATAISRIVGKDTLSDLNPVTTIGSMQVKLTYAKDVPDFRGMSDVELREKLYTRAGGITAGTHRLLAYEAAYDDIIFRFADFNAGVYASRNAAYQAQLSDLTGVKLVTDGDLLAYEDDGDLADTPSETLKAMELFAIREEIWESTVRRSARQEKSVDFEDTTMWKKLKAAWEKKKGRPAPYAEVPRVTLESPKLSAGRSTAWFATNVKKRYEACRQR